MPEPPATPETGILAWHFVTLDPETGAYRTGEGGLPVVPGQVMAVDPPLKLCSRGLDASRRAIDALGYAPGPVVQRVRLSGTVIEGSDKLCASRRECLWAADATTALHLFACDVAAEALERERAAGREPDARSWAAVETKRRWVRGEATDADLAAARAAAWDAAWDAAWAAAWDAAGAATGGASGPAPVAAAPAAAASPAAALAASQAASHAASPALRASVIVG